MTNKEIKMEIIERLFNQASYIKQVNEVEYRTRCPYCGDSLNNLNTGHLYIRINPEDNFPIVYNCFKCNESGIADQDFLSLMDINDINLKSSITTMNKTSDKMKSHNFLNGDKVIMFNYNLPKCERGKKVKYLEDRLQTKFTDEDLRKTKVITSLYDFLKLNHIHKLMVDENWANDIEKNYVGFLSFGGSHIFFRDITNTRKFRWIKYPITDESKQCRAFYSIESSIDIFSKDTIEINLAEGVLDIVSYYKNIKNKDSNSIEIAVCGKQYSSVLLKLVNLGFVGNNIILNIYADNDEKYNDNKNNVPTDIKYFKRTLRLISHLYKEVNVFYNEVEKDIGVPKENILLQKFRL